MKDLVLYGAGNNSADVYIKFLKQGCKPVCLCDSDSKKIGQVRYFDDGDLEILSIDEVLKKYPDADFYITLDAPEKFEIMEKLQEMGVNQSKIINYEPYEKRNTCPHLEKHLYTGNGSIALCCVYYYNVEIPYVSLNLDNEELLDALKTKRQEAFDVLNGNADCNLCSGCPEIRSTYVSKEASQSEQWELDFVGFGSGTVCNLKCIYCDTKNKMKIPWEKRYHYVKRSIDFLAYLKKIGIFNDAARIHPAPGEISIHPLKSEILKLFENNPCEILTNGVVYCEDVENVLRVGKSNMHISLDSGTPDTFERVKGVGEYYKTIENIRRYSKYAKYIKLKYILIPGKNDSVKDIEGFLDFAKEINALVVLSRDFFGVENYEKNIDDAIRAVKYFEDGTKQRDLKLYMSKHMLIDEHKEKLKKL